MQIQTCTSCAHLFHKGASLRLLCELCLHGVFAKDGVQVLGSTISYLTLTDKSEHVNVPILLSLCKALGADVFGLHPYSIKQVSFVPYMQVSCL